MTLRDKVWDESLRQVQSTGKFKISDLSFDESERHTVRRVLKRMEESGWLQRESEHAAIWRLGPAGQELLNVSEDARHRAEA